MFFLLLYNRDLSRKTNSWQERLQKIMGITEDQWVVEKGKLKEKVSYFTPQKSHIRIKKFAEELYNDDKIY